MRVTDDQLRLAFKQAMKRMEEAGTKQGFLGDLDDDGNWVFDIEGKPGFQYARIEEGGTVTIAEVINSKVTPDPYAPVEIAETGHGLLYVKGYALEEVASMVNDGAAMGEVAAHGHGIRSGREYVHEARLFDQARVYPSSGMIVAIAPFLYYDPNGVRRWYEGGTLDLSAYVPSSNKQVMVGVYLDTVTGIPSARAGSEQPISTTMTQEHIAAISFASDEEVLTGVVLRWDTTTINSESMFREGRVWFGARGGSSGTGVVATTEQMEVRKLLWKQTLSGSGSFDTDNAPDAGTDDLSGYDHLYLRLYNARGTVAATSDILYLRFNGDATDANYRSQRTSNGASANSSTPVIGVVPASTGDADYVGLIEVLIPDYAGSKFKQSHYWSIYRATAALQEVRDGSHHWESTAAITRIQIVTDNDPTDLLAEDTVLEVWGIKQQSMLTGVSGGGAASARAATTADITLSGAQTVDDVSIGDDDIVLVMNQTAADENGLYVASAAGAWARSGVTLSAGMLVTVQEGTVNADTVWILTTDEPFVVDTDDIAFARSGIKHSAANVTNPPTDAELDTAFGTPAVAGAGFIGTLDDNGGGANFYFVASDGANWWYVAGTKAV
jgi:NACalpha-BTF3-like transcription factor